MCSLFDAFYDGRNTSFVLCVVVTKRSKSRWEMFGLTVLPMIRI